MPIFFFAKYAQTLVEAKTVYEAYGAMTKHKTASLYLPLAAIFFSLSSPIL